MNGFMFHNALSNRTMERSNNNKKAETMSTMMSAKWKFNIVVQINNTNKVYVLAFLLGEEINIKFLMDIISQFNYTPNAFSIWP